MRNISNRKFPIVLIDGPINTSEFVKPVRESGWHLLNVSNTGGIIPTESDLIGAIVGWPIDHPRLHWLRKLNCPVVRVGLLPNPKDVKVPAVISDLKAIGRMAADHLIERHFQHFGFIGNNPWEKGRPGKTLYHAFSEQAKKHGGEIHLLRIKHFKNHGILDRSQKLYKKVKEWLNKCPKPIGIFAYHDWLASQIIIICHKTGLAVPEQVSVIGHGNVEKICETALLTITSIDTGQSIKAKEAVSILHRIIKGKSLPKSPVFIPPVAVIERESTDILAVNDQLVTKVIRFIWDNLDQQLTIEEIAGKFGVSRPVLDRKFKLALGRSPNTERQRKRLEKCTALLRGTNMNITDIAKYVGFPSISYFYRSFQKEFGMTPRAYRIGKD